MAICNSCSSAQPLGGSNKPDTPIGTAAATAQAIATAQAPETAQAVVVHSFPQGLVVSDNEKNQPKPIGGVYPGVGDPDPACCWLGPKAQVTVARSGGGRSVTATIYVANIQYLTDHPQTVSLSVGGHSHRFTDIKPGIHKLTFALDPSIKNGPFQMAIVANAFVPSKVDPNNHDSRPLSIILSQVGVQ